MESVVLVIHLFLALAIIGLVLLQKSEGGGLGIGGGGGGMGALAGARSTANFLTKATSYCAIAFFCTSLLLGVLAGGHSGAGTSIMDKLDDVSGTAAIEQSIPDAPSSDDLSVETPTQESSGVPSVPIQ